MAQYIGKDKERYDAGNQYLSLDKYLQNYQTKAPITFNPSQSNTGIISAYNPYPIIPMYGDGDGGDKPPPGPRGPGYGYTSVYDPVKQNKEFQYDIGEATITKEEEDFAKRQALKRGLVTIGKAALFGPLEYTIGKGVKQAASFGINKAKDFFGNDGGSDEININKDGVFTKESIDSYFRGEEGPTGGSTTDTRGGAPSHSTRDLMSYGGRAGYKDGYSVQDDMTDYATNVGREASPGGGFQDSGDGDTPNNNTFYEPTNTSNLDFSMVKDVNPAFSYANNFGKFGGVLDTTKTIEEEEPVGTIGYFSPSGNFGIGYDTDLGTVSKANLGNFNLGYTGQDGVNASYMGGFAGDAGRLGVNYDKDGLNFGLRFEKNFNNGGIVGMYR